MSSRFNEIASIYDAEIPLHIRMHLLRRKTDMMLPYLIHLDKETAVGLDLGCGTGWHVARLRQMGFQVWGVDNSIEQLREAQNRITHCPDSCWCLSDIRHLPCRDESIDFAFAINVIHHVESRSEQLVTVREIHRVLKPGGYFFLHEVNTTNAVMALYMNYVFPRIRKIDNGLEHWIVPEDLRRWPGFDLLNVTMFTFVPDFTPRLLFPLLCRLEGWLEATPLRRYAAHYMAVLQRRE